MLDRVVEGLCERILDHNRKVQEAACGSLANLTEEAGASLAAYGPRVLTALGLALTRYGRRSLRSAYDALVTIADYCPAALRAPEAASACLPQLFGKIPTYSDGDKDLLPLLECVGAVTAVTGPHLQPYAEGLFGRYVDMADRLIAGVQSGAYEKEESDEFVVAALDALSGLVEGLGAGAESLIARSSALEVLKHCVADVNPDVRQSAFAVVGEIARACLPRLRPSMQDLVGACLANVEPAAITQPSIGACNNAAWALGEVALQCRPDEAASFALPALERLVRILAAPAGGLPRSLVENAAVALGRIAIVAPEPMAPHAMVFVGPWCSALRGVLDGKEKRDAFLGLCAVLERNPDGGGAAFSVLCESVASWRDLREESSSGLKSKLTELMQRYKTRLLELGQWDAAMSSLSPAVRQKLANMFSL
jgi:transportin-1